jgi:hypothetical protein
MNLLAYRNFVDTCYTEEEVRAMCEDVEVVDGPDDTGEMFDRPAKLSDHLVPPYPNEEVKTHRVTVHFSCPTPLTTPWHGRPPGFPTAALCPRI